MFGISFSEILLILLISLLIFGPEQLPEIARKLGKGISYLRRLRFNLRDHLYQHSGLNQFENIREELQQTISDFRQQLQATADLEFTSSRPLAIDASSTKHCRSSAYPQFSSDEEDEEFIYPETRLSAFQYLYQPELDFARQAELFDEL